MISLPGLTIATGRYDVARSILQTFSKYGGSSFRLTYEVYFLVHLFANNKLPDLYPVLSR